MLKDTVRAKIVPQIKFAIKFFTIFAAFIIGLISLPASAQMQSDDWLQTAAGSKQELQSPQAARPDILWMRGGQYQESLQTTYSPDGQYVAQFVHPGSGADLRIYRASDGMMIRTIKVASVDAYSFAFTPDSRTIVVGAADTVNSATAWFLKYVRVSDGVITQSVPLSGMTVTRLAISPNGQYIGIADGDKNGLWNFSDGSFIRFFNSASSGGGAIVFSPDSTTAAAQASGFYNLYNINGALIRSLNATGDITFSPSGQLAAVANGGGVDVLNVSCRPNCAPVFSVAGQGLIVNFSPDGQKLAASFRNPSITNDEVARVWNTSNWSLIRSFDSPRTILPWISFAPDSIKLVVGAIQTNVWNTNDGSLVSRLGYFQDRAVTVAMSSDGQTLAAANRGNHTNTIQLFNTADGSLKNVTFPQSLSLNITNINFADNNQKIITATAGGSVQVWNAVDGSLISNTSITPSNVTILVSPDGQYYIVGTTAQAFYARLYRVSDGALIRTFISDGGADVPLAFSADGQTLATRFGDTSTVRIWRVSDGAVIRNFTSGAANTANGAFSPDGQFFVAGNWVNNQPTVVKLWRVSDGALLQSMTGHTGRLDRVAFAPDGQTIVSAGWDNTLRFWRVSDGALLQTYDQETRFELSDSGQIVFSSDGSRFAYGRADASVVMARNPYSTTPPTTFMISGQITRGGSALSNVSVALTGNSSSGATTDANGNYSFTVNEGGSYTVTPQLSGNNFTPQSQTFNFVSQNQTADFTAQLITYTISGNVKADGANLAGATVSLSGGQSAATTTDASGNYSFTVPAGGNYTVSVYKSGINFNPASQSFTNLQANQTANFQNGVPYCAPPSAGLVGWYKGEGNSNDSVGGNNGTIFGADYDAATAKVGQSFRLYGTTGYVQIPDAETNRLTDRGSISLWLRLNTSADGVILDKGRADTNQASYTLEIYQGTLRFDLYKGDGGTSYATVDFPAAEIVGQWTHLTATWDVGTLQLYKNSVARSSANYAFTRVARSDSVFIGHSTNTARPPINGNIDELQFYSRAVSAAESAAIYNAGSAGVCSSNVASTSVSTASNGKIAFWSQRTGFDIWAMNADGTGQTNVSNNNNIALDIYGEWSPDGSKIVFASYRNSNYDIYTMNADGTNQTRLTTDAAIDNTPSWSPDGTRIVFASQRNDSPATNAGYEIYVMNADGTNQTRLTDSPKVDSHPKFSPDGSRIAFYSERTNNYEIWVMNADGSNLVNLTNSSSFDGFPNWSPDGSKIVFDSDRGNIGGTEDIWVMNSNGTNPVNLSNSPASSEYFPAFSPDGSKVAFTSNTNTVRDIYVMNAANGSNKTRLTNDGSSEYPSWQRVAGNTVVAPSSNVNLTFANVSQAGSTVATPIAPASAGVLPAGYQLIQQSIAFDISTSATFSGNITTAFDIASIPDSSTCASLRVFHYNAAINRLENVTTGTSFNATTHVCTLTATTTSLSPFVIAQALAPTAASVSIGGRVLSASGDDIRQALVTLTDANGNSRTTLSGKFGAYRFANVAAGETYIISVRARLFSFGQSVQTRTANTDLSGVDFIANE